MTNKEALKILRAAINYSEDGSYREGIWILSPQGISAVKIAISAIEEVIKEE